MTTTHCKCRDSMVPANHAPTRALATLAGALPSFTASWKDAMLVCQDTMVMIASSGENGLMYSMTANLDGETNLKLRKVHPSIMLNAKTTSIKTECGKLFAFIDCKYKY